MTTLENKLADLLKRSAAEIINLRNKLRLKEEEGWEGSKRRCILEGETMEVLRQVDDYRYYKIT